VAGQVLAGLLLLFLLLGLVGVRAPLARARSLIWGYEVWQAPQLDSQATADGVNSTPTILVGKSGTTPTPVTLRSLTDPKAVVDAIAAASR
jgi:hypothetical protein